MGWFGGLLAVNYPFGRCHVTISVFHAPSPFLDFGTDSQRSAPPWKYLRTPWIWGQRLAPACFLTQTPRKTLDSTTHHNVFQLKIYTGARDCDRTRTPCDSNVGRFLRRIGTGWILPDITRYTVHGRGAKRNFESNSSRDT